MGPNIVPKRPQAVAWVASVSAHCKPIDSVILSARGYGHTLFTQKTTFCFHSSYPAITAQTSIAPNHSVTWNDGRVWVLSASIGYRTGRIRMPDLNRNFGVGSDLAPRDFFHCIPDLDLELGPLKRGVLGHMSSRFLDNIILPIIARVPFDSYTIEENTLYFILKGFENATSCGLLN